MFSDHQNLLSTFGKDSQSSQRKSKNISLKSKKAALIFDEPKSKYQQILNQRKNQINLIKDKESIKIFQLDSHHVNSNHLSNNNNNNNKFIYKSKQRQKQNKQKLRTQTDIQYLNSRIRKSISGIAESICKSKIKSNNGNGNANGNGKQKVSEFEVQYQKQQRNRKNQENRGSSLKKNKNSDGGVSLYNLHPNNTKSRQLNQSYSQHKFIKNANNCSYSLSNTNVNNINNTNFNCKKRNNHHEESISHSNKQNLDINAFEISYKNSKQKDHNITNNYDKNYSHSNQYLKNSTKKKNNLLLQKNSYPHNNNNIQTQPDQHFSPQQQQIQPSSYYPIKSSFSIDLNSHSSSRYGSSQRKYQKQNSKRKKQYQIDGNYVQKVFVNQNNINNLNIENNLNKSINENNKNNRLYKLDSKFIINKQMEDTLKKQNKNNTNNNKYKYNKNECYNYSHFDEKNYVKEISFQQTKGHNKQNKFSTNQQFFFYDDLKQITLRNQQNHDKYLNRFSKNPHISHKAYTQQNRQYQQPNSPLKTITTKFPNPFQNPFLISHPWQYHPLISSFITQIQLDYNLRHAKHMFSGIQQPYFHNLSPQSQLKWQKLNNQLQKIGLFYPIQRIKQLFLPSQQQLDPFLSCSQPHQQLLYSLIFAYQKSQSFWESQIYQKWQHWDLRDIDFTIESIDRNRKGYISVEDIAVYLAMQTGIEYKNRDVVLIYKRFLCLRNLGQDKDKDIGNESHNRRGNDSHNRRGNDSHNCRQNDSDNEGKLKFRTVIDSLIRPFNKKIIV